MDISEDLYSWLRASNIIPAASKYNKKNRISELDIENLEYGCLFSQVLQRTISLLNDPEKKILLKNSIDSIKNYKTRSSMKHNWTIIKMVLTEIGVQIDYDDVELIKAGSKETLEQLLETIFKFEQNFFNRSDSESTPKLTKPQARYKSGELVIETLSGKIPLDSTKSSLEFLLVSFCKHFKLHPKQAAGLLTQSGKYLSYLCSRGFKGKHEIISAWIEEIHFFSSHLVKLLLQDMNSLSLVLTSLAYCINSRELGNVEKASKLLKVLFLDLVNEDNGLDEIMWTWFAANGVDICLSALRRFGAYVKNEVISMFYTFASSNFKELFTVILPELIPEIIQYLAFMHELIVEIGSGRYKDFLASQQVYEFLIELALDQAENQSIQADERMTSINILCEIWRQTSIIDLSEEYSSRVIKTFEKISREKSVLLKISCLSRFFNLLEHLAESRNSFAPVVYKIITFSLVENFSELETKEFIMSNFITLFSRVDIPLKILLEPLAKHLTISAESDFSIVDFYFFASIASHPHLTVKLGLIFIDSLAKLLVDHEFYADLIGEIMLRIIRTFVNTELFQEYLVRFVAVYLKIVERIAISNKDLFKVQVLQKVLENCLELRVEPVNEEAEMKLCSLLVENSVPSINDWIMNMLQLCGDPEVIIEKYKKVIGFPSNEVKKVQVEEKKNRDLISYDKERGRDDKRKVSVKKSMRQQIETKKINIDNNFVAEIKSNSKIIEVFDEEQMGLVKILNKSKKTVFREVFKKFSAKRRVSKSETFDKLNESVNTILDTDIFKVLKKIVKPEQMLTQSQFVEFSKEFSQLYQKTKSYFEFNDFQFFLAYISQYIYTKPPEDFCLYPTIYSYIYLLSQIEQEYPPTSQTPVVDSTSQVPAGYKKLKSKDLKLTYSVPAALNLPPSSTYSISILDDLLFSLFSFHILEAQSTICPIYTLQQDLTFISSKAPSNPSVSSTPKRLLNKFHEKKIQQQLAEVEEKKAKEKKRLLRVQIVKSQISKISNTVTSKKLEDKKKTQEDEEKKLILIKRLEEKIEKDRKARLEEIEMWKKKKEDEIKAKNELEKEKLEKERMVRIKRREEFLENERVRLKNLSIEIAESKKKIPEIEAQKMEIEKKLREKKIEKHKSTLEIARKQKSELEMEERELMEEFNSEKVQGVIRLYENSFQLVFLHFCNSRHLPNYEGNLISSMMSFPDFYKFAVQFKIVPEVLSKDESKKLFIHTRRGSEIPSITFEGFKFLCFRISKSLSYSQTEESDQAENFSSLQALITRLELSKDINSVRNLLRRQETLKQTKSTFPQIIKIKND